MQPLPHNNFIQRDVEDYYLQFSRIIYSLHKSLIVTFCHIIKYRILIFHDTIDITFAEGVNPV